MQQSNLDLLISSYEQKLAETFSTQFLYEFGAHSDNITNVLFTPDGLHIISASEDRSIKIWNFASKTLVHHFKQAHNRSVDHIAISPDGKYLISCSFDKEIKYWDLETNKPCGRIEIDQADVCSLCISPCGKYIVAGLDDESIRVWDFKSRRLLYERPKVHFPENPDDSSAEFAIKSVRVSSDSQFVISASEDCSIKIWKLVNLEPFKTISKAHSEAITVLAMSNDGKYMISGGEDHSIKVWNFENKEEVLHHFKDAHESEIISLAVSNDSKFFMTGAEDGHAKVWSIESGAVVNDFKDYHKEGVCSVAFSPDGTHLLTGSRDHTFNLWSSDFGFLIHEFKGAHDDAVINTVYTPDGKYIITGGKDKTIKLWNPVSKKNVFTEILAHGGIISWIEVAKSGKFFLTCSNDKSIKVWTIGKDTIESKDIIQKAHTLAIYQLSISPDDSTVISCSKDKSIKMWKISSKELIATIENAHLDEIKCVKFSNNKGDFFLSASKDMSIKQWSTSTRNLIHTFSAAHNSCIWAIAISADNSTLLSGSEDSLKMWNLEKRRLIRTLHDQESSIKAITYSPDQKFIVSTHDSDLRVWNAETLNLVSFIPRTSLEYINTVSFEPKGENFVIGSEDKTFRIWPFKKNLEDTKVAKAHKSDIYGIQITLDDKNVVTCSSDKTIKVWDLATKALVKTFEDPKGGDYDKLAVSPDSRYVIASTDHNIRLWDIENDTMAHSFDEAHDDYIGALEFTPDGEHFISATDEIKVWHIETRKLDHHITKAHVGKISNLSMSIDGLYLASAAYDCSIKLWNYDKKTLKYHFQNAHIGKVSQVKISSDRKLMVSGGGNNGDEVDIKVWSLETMLELFSFKNAHGFSIYHLLISRDCQFIVTAAAEENIKIWSIATRGLVHQISPTKKKQADVTWNGISLSQNGRQLVAADTADILFYSLPSLLTISKDFCLDYMLMPRFGQAYTILPFNWNEYHYKVITKEKFDIEKACEDDAFCALDFQGKLPLDYLHTPDHLKIFNIDSHKLFSYKLKCIERLQQINYFNYLRVMKGLAPNFINILRSETHSNPKIVSSFLKLCNSPDNENEFRQVSHGHVPLSYGEPSGDFVECDYPIVNPENQKSLTKHVVEDITKEVKSQKLKYMRTVMPLHLSITSSDTRNILHFLNLQTKRFFFEDEFMNLVLDYLWERSKIFQTILFIIYSIFMTFVSVETCYSESPIEWIQIVVLIFSCILFLYEMIQTIHHGLDLWNSLDVICYSLVIATMSLLISGSNDPVIPYLKTIYILTGYFRWIGYLRIADGMRSLIRTIIEIFKDMAYFLLILFFTIMAYACVLEAFTYGDEPKYLLSLHKAYLFLYDSTLDPEPEDGLKAITVLFPLIINVVFLNMLISIMGDTYDKIQEKKTYADNQERVDMILEIVQTAFRFKIWGQKLTKCFKRRKPEVKTFSTSKFFTIRPAAISCGDLEDLQYPTPEEPQDLEKKPFCLIRCDNESEDIEDDWDGKLNFLLKRNVDAINESKVEIQNSMNNLLEQKLTASQESMKKMIEMAIGDVVDLKIKAMFNDRISALETKIDRLAMNAELPNKIDEFSEQDDQPSKRIIK